MSENYFQHADHFTRVLSEQEIYKKSKYSESPNISSLNKDYNQNKIEQTSNKKDDGVENNQSENFRF